MSDDSADRKKKLQKVILARPQWRDAQNNN